MRGGSFLSLGAIILFACCTRDVRPAAAQSVPGFWDRCSKDEDCRPSQKCLNFPEGRSLDLFLCQIPCEAADGGLDPSQCPNELTCYPGQHGSDLPKCEPWSEPKSPLLFKGPDGVWKADAGTAPPEHGR